jgi:DHA1 family inner membrane transport protein
MPPLLWLFMLTNLVIGTGAFAPGGLVEPIAAGLGTGVAGAGQAMTAYAVVTAIGAPFVLMATGGWPRRRVLLLGLVLFALGNAVCAAAGSLAMLYAGRVLMGLGAVFTPVAAGIAVTLVPPAQRGRALAFVFLGVSLSYVTGLPLVTWAGLEFGWRWPLAAVALAALCMLAVLAWRVPAALNAPGASFAGLASLAAHGALKRTLAVTLLYFTAIFTVFSYVGPVLTALVPMGASALALTIAGFGVSGVVGTLLGGWANDRFGARRTLTAQLALLASMMVLVPFTAGNHAAMLAAFLAWGVAGFGMMAPQQSRLTSFVPASAPLALSLNTSMVYLGTAAGAAVGGLAVARLGFAGLAWAGLPFALAALALLALDRGARAALPARAAR